MELHDYSVMKFRITSLSWSVCFNKSYYYFLKQNNLHSSKALEKISYFKESTLCHCTVHYLICVLSGKVIHNSEAYSLTSVTCWNISETKQLVHIGSHSFCLDVLTWHDFKDIVEQLASAMLSTLVTSVLKLMCSTLYCG